MPEYDNQTIMRQEIEHSFDSDNIDWLSIPLERQKTHAADTNIFEPTSQFLSSPHLPIENPTIKNIYGAHKILTSKGSNLIADDDLLAKRAALIADAENEQKKFKQIIGKIRAYR